MMCRISGCPMMQVLLEPQEGLMGCLVEARIVAASRWSLSGAVTAVVFAPPGAAPVALAPDLARGAGDGQSGTQSCSGAEAEVRSSRSGEEGRQSWAEEGLAAAVSSSKETGAACGGSGAAGRQPWGERAAAAGSRSGFQAGEAVERSSYGEGAVRGPDQADRGAAERASTLQREGMAAGAAAAEEGTSLGSWQAGPGAQRGRPPRARLSREEGLRRMVELTGASLESCTALLDSLLEGQAAADARAGDVGAGWSGAGHAQGEALLRRPAGGVRQLPGQQEATAGCAGLWRDGMPAELAPNMQRTRRRAAHVLNALLCASLLLALSGILVLGMAEFLASQAELK